MKRFLYIMIIFSGCKDVYNPSVKNANYNYLVVEGNIVAGNDSTFIHLSRTVTVSDTSRVHPEPGATITIEGDGGDTYPLQDQFTGVYTSPPLNITPNENYRLHIFTGGKEYVSDFVPVKQTPAIDSISWKFDQGTGGVNIYANSHDVTNNTQYYRWQYVETWEHRPKDTCEMIYSNGALRYRLPEEQIYRCWNTNISGSIFIASTVGLSSDVVYEKLLVKIPYGSEELSRVYSILVTQYALTKEAFEYWDNLKKNTEQLGSIFDPQPFAEFGNIHCITNSEEPVLGYISACSASQKRIYIKSTEIGWLYYYPDCKDTVVGLDRVDEVFSGVVYLPIRPVFGGIIAEFSQCADCRQHGGTTIKPPYMP